MPERRRLDVIEYADWKQGSQFGKGLLPGHGQPSDYQAFNMQVYTNGSLGPRPYFVPTDVDLDESVAAGVATPLTQLPTANGHGLYVDRGTGAVLLIANGVAYGATWLSGIFSSVGTPVRPVAAPTPTPSGNFYVLADRFQFTPVSSTVVFVGAAFTWNPSSPITAMSAVTWPGGALPAGVGVWKERSFGFGASAAPNRIYYSDAGAVTTFTSASQYFDVGTSGIVGVYPLRDALLIAEENGTWHALTGGSPATWSRREIGKMRAANTANRPVVWRNAVWQLSRSGRGIAVITPEGVNETELSWVQPTIDPYINNPQIVPLVAVGSHESNSLFLPFIADNANGTPVATDYPGFQALELVNGAFTWSKMWTDVPGSGYGQSGDDAAGVRILGAWEYNGSIIIAVDESRLANNSTDRVRLYARPFYLDRPSQGSLSYGTGREELAGVYNDGGTSDTNMAAGQVWLRQYAPPPGNKVRVSKVIADVNYWSTELYDTPAVTMQVSNTDGIVTTIAHTAADHSLTYTADNFPGRIEWKPAPGPASEFVQVKLTGIKSIAFRKLIVEYEVFPE